MTNIASLVILCVIIVESLIVFSENIFTILVFWRHRNRLKRTSFLLINLAVADLLVGFMEPIAIGTIEIPRNIGAVSNRYAQISTASFTAFSSASMFFLVLISVERVYALIWPLRHRAASPKGYIYSIFCVWVAGISVGGLSLLAAYEILNVAHWMVTNGAIVILALTMICLSYLTIRRKLYSRVPVVGLAHNQETVHNRSKKLSRTLFVVIAVSVFLWFPGIVIIWMYFLCSRCVPEFLVYISTMLHVGNSLVNPIIYSFRMAMFRETLNRMMPRKWSKQYRVHYRP